MLHTASTDIYTSNRACIHAHIYTRRRWCRHLATSSSEDSVADLPTARLVLPVPVIDVDDEMTLQLMDLLTFDMFQTAVSVPLVVVFSIS